VRTVEVTVWGIIGSLQGHSVILADREHERVLPIVIGIPEALAIHSELESRRFARPMTHDLIAQSFAAVGAEVESIVITDLQDGTFFARIHARVNGRRHSIDSRPSDALAVALRVGAPIYVSEAVMLEAAHEAAPDRLEETLSEEVTEPHVIGSDGDPEAPHEEVEKFRDILRAAGLDEPMG